MSRRDTGWTWSPWSRTRLPAWIVRSAGVVSEALNDDSFSATCARRFAEYWRNPSAHGTCSVWLPAAAIWIVPVTALLPTAAGAVTVTLIVRARRVPVRPAPDPESECRRLRGDLADSRGAEPEDARADSERRGVTALCVADEQALEGGAV